MRNKVNRKTDLDQARLIMLENTKKLANRLGITLISKGKLDFNQVRHFSGLVVDDPLTQDEKDLFKRVVRQNFTTTCPICGLPMADHPVPLKPFGGPLVKVPCEGDRLVEIG